MIRKVAILISLAAVLAVLGACTSTEQTLDPKAIAQPSTTAPAAAATAALVDPSAPHAKPPSAAQLASAAAAARIQIAPIVGATAEAAQPLTARIAERASARGLRVAAAGDGTATHVMKGYFSAISDDGKTTVIFVWDVLDPAGNRLHRIQGQQTASGKGEGWAAVPAATMQAIADQTVDQLMTWLAAGAAG